MWPCSCVSRQEEKKVLFYTFEFVYFVTMPSNLQKIPSLAKICSIFLYNAMKKNVFEGSLRHFCPLSHVSCDSGPGTSRDAQKKELSPSATLTAALLHKKKMLVRMHSDTLCDVTKGQILLFCFPLSGRGFRTAVSDNHASERDR